MGASPSSDALPDPHARRCGYHECFGARPLDAPAASSSASGRPGGARAAVSVAVHRAEVRLERLGGAAARPFVTASCVGGGAPSRPVSSHSARTPAVEASHGGGPTASAALDGRFAFHFAAGERPEAVRLRLWNDTGGGAFEALGESVVPLRWGGGGGGGGRDDGWLTVHDEESKEPSGRVLVHVGVEEEADAALLGRLSYTHLLRVRVDETRALRAPDGAAGTAAMRPRVRLEWGLERVETREGRGAARAALGEEALFWFDERWHRDHRLRVEALDRKDALGVAYLDAAELRGAASLPGAAFSLRLLPHEAFTALSDRDLRALAAREADSEAFPEQGEVRLRCRLVPRVELERRLLRSLVERFDVDGDGRLGTGELAAALGALQFDVSADRLAELVARVDRDGNGYVEQDEVHYLVRCLELEQPGAVDRVLRALADPDATAALMAPLQGDEPPHLVVDRATGLAVTEHVPAYVRVALRAMATGPFARGARGLLRRASVRQGRLFDDPSSRDGIRKFVRLHRIDYAEAELPLDEYRTFNDFFARRLAEGARPVASPGDDRAALSPADCRLHVFPSGDDARRLWIKGAAYSSDEVLGGGERAAPFRGGPVAVARLAPQDYHWWHAPASGTLGERYEVDGALLSVSPMLVRSPINVFTENKRLVQMLDSPEFGRVAVVAVGATMVGSIRTVRAPGDRVRRGDPLGHFRFGGSTVLLYFEPGRVSFDADLLSNSMHARETLVRACSGLGRAAGAAAPVAAEAAAAEPVPAPDTQEQLEAVEAAVRAEAAAELAPPPGALQGVPSANFARLMEAAEKRRLGDAASPGSDDEAPRLVIDSLGADLGPSGGALQPDRSVNFARLLAKAEQQKDGEAAGGGGGGVDDDDDDVHLAPGVAHPMLRRDSAPDGFSIRLQ